MAAPCSNTTYSYVYVQGKPVTSDDGANLFFQHHKVKSWSQMPRSAQAKSKGTGVTPKSKLLSDRRAQTSPHPSPRPSPLSSECPSPASSSAFERDSKLREEQANEQAWHRQMDERQRARAESRKRQGDTRQQTRDKTKQRQSQDRQQAKDKSRNLSSNEAQRTYHSGLGEGLARASRYVLNLRDHTFAEICDQELGDIIARTQDKVRYEGRLFSLHHSVHDKSLDAFDLEGKGPFMSGVKAFRRLNTLLRYRKDVEVIEKAQHTIARYFSEQMQELAKRGIDIVRERFELERAHYLTAHEDLRLQGLTSKTSYESLTKSSCGPSVRRLEAMKTESLDGIKKASLQFQIKCGRIRDHLDSMIRIARSEADKEPSFRRSSRPRTGQSTGSSYSQSSGQRRYTAPEPKGMTRTQAYGLLGVKPGASKTEIGRAYRKKSLKVHPDKNPNIPDQIFKDLSKAYDMLK